MELTARNEAALSMSFKAAFLLTADAELAEGVVIEALEKDDNNEISLERLVTRAVLAASLARFPVVRKPHQRFRFLAPQLRSVLNLQDDLRRCFVGIEVVGTALPDRRAADAALAGPVDSREHVDARAARARRMTHATRITGHACGHARAAAPPRRRPARAHEWRR